MSETSNSKQHEFNVYPRHFNIQSNYSIWGRLFNVIFIISFLILIPILIPFSEEVVIFIAYFFVFGTLIISGKYFRKLYPDWPKEQKFIGKMTLEKERIKVEIEGKEENYELNNIEEIVVFIDYYTGYSINFRDIIRNGNSLIFIKEKNGSSAFIKFNIYSELEYRNFNHYIDTYQEKIDYLKKYLTSEINNILKPDLTSRINYN